VTITIDDSTVQEIWAALGKPDGAPFWEVENFIRSAIDDAVSNEMDDIARRELAKKNKQ
jgi:hypothetical protein